MSLPNLHLRKLGDYEHSHDHSPLATSEIFELWQGGVHLGWITGHSDMRIRHGEKPGEIVVQFLPWHLRPDWPKSAGQLGDRELDDPRDPRYQETLNALRKVFDEAPKGGDRGDPFGDEPYNRLKHWEHKAAEVEPEPK